MSVRGRAQGLDESALSAGRWRWVVARLSHPAALWLVLVVAAAIRFATLGQQSFWDDEGYTVGLMRSANLHDLLHGVARTESAPPTYYVLAWLWTHVFGISEYGLRSMSAVAGVLTVLVCYRIGATLASRAAGVVAGSAAAVNPLLIWYSQEARAYALFALVASVELLFFVRALMTRSRGDVWKWATASALALATHYFALFLVIPETIVLARSYRRSLRILLPPIAVIVATGVALAPLALEQRGKRFAFANSPLSRRVAQIPEQFLVGYGVWATPWGKLAAAAAFVCVLVGGLLTIRPDRAAGRFGPVLLGLAATATVLPIAYATVGTDYVLTLYFVAVLPLLAVAVSLGWARSGIGLAAALAYVLIAVAVEAAVVATPEFQREDIRGVASELEHPCASRAIVVSPATVLTAYMTNLMPMKQRGASVDEIDLVAMAVKQPGQHETVPRKLRTNRPAPGFRLARTDYARRFTVFAFRTAVPRRVSPAALARARLGPWPADRASVEIETCGGR